VASLAKDICNQRSYRSRRRREIFRLQKTILDLEKKIEFHGSQVDYYDQYLKQCLANLHVAKKKRVQFRTPNHTVSCQKYDYSNVRGGGKLPIFRRSGSEFIILRMHL
jgi:hypothetical protein